MVRLLLRKFIFMFSPLAVALSFMCLLIYLAGAQYYRNAIDNPQREIANRVVEFLNKGIPPQQLVGREQVEINTSLSAHVTICDEKGNLLASTARLNGQAPTPPAKELAVALEEGENTFTWQPDKRTDLRCAAVTVPFKGGTVTAAKSLAMVGRERADLMVLVLAIWFVTLLVLAGVQAAVIYMQMQVLRNPM